MNLENTTVQKKLCFFKKNQKNLESEIEMNERAYWKDYWCTCHLGPFLRIFSTILNVQT